MSDIQQPNNFKGFHIRTGEMSAFDMARAAFAGDVREVINEILSTSASVADVESAHAMLAQAVKLLQQREHKDYEGAGEAALAAVGSFLDRSPLIGTLNPIAVPLRIVTETDADGTVNAVGRVTFGSPYEGPPGCVHGGFIAAAFDEVLGVSQSTSGNPGMTVNLSINYRSPTPLRKEIVFRGRIESISGRKIFTVGTLHHGEILCAEATAIFVSMRPELFERLLKIRQSEAG